MKKYKYNLQAKAQASTAVILGAEDENQARTQLYRSLSQLCWQLSKVDTTHTDIQLESVEEDPSDTRYKVGVNLCVNDIPVSSLELMVVARTRAEAAAKAMLEAQDSSKFSILVDPYPSIAYIELAE